MVGDELVSTLESVSQTNNQVDLFTSSNNISLEQNKISEKEYSLFKLLSDLLLFQGGWTFEYLIDIQSNIHILSFDNGYDLDEFRSSTSDLLIPQIINKLFINYHKRGEENLKK